MKVLGSAVLYTGLALSAIFTGLSAPAMAQQPDIAAHATGALKKLAVHSDPKPLDTAVTWDGPEGTASLADYAGKWVLLNFWAVWCAPCREEMPTLDALQQDLGGDGFQVVTLSTGPGPAQGVDKFFDKTGVTALPRFRDEKGTQARGAGVLALPVTLLVDPEGREVARLIGGADWNSEEARALVAALTSAGAG